MPPFDRDKMGLVLTGGGARGAYQAGVLKALAEISVKGNRPYPFDVVTGVSAGSINAAYWASCADNIEAGMEKLVRLWENLTSEHVFRSDFFSMARIGGRLALDISTGPISGAHLAQGLLDTAPLDKLIRANILFDNIQKNIDAGCIHSVAVTATDYASSESITFIQGREPIEVWDRPMRRGERALLRSDHIMGSSAIPLFFPPVEVDGRYFGDGCLRNVTPLGPSIHLGSNKLVIVGVRKQPPSSEISYSIAKPSVGRVLSIVLNAILLDGVDRDVERLSRINQTLKLVSAEKKNQLSLRPIDFLWIHPSEDIGQMAQGETHRLPRILKFLIKGLGPMSEASGISSYLLFEPSFCGRLAELGYKDTMVRKTEIEDFFS